MRTLVIGNVKGNTRWKQLIKKNPADHVVFMGDYLNNRDKEVPHLADNLSDIIDYKERHFDTTTLLLSRNDIQYMYSYDDFRTYTYNEEIDAHLNETMVEAHERNYFNWSKLVETKDNFYLLSSAGFTSEFANTYTTHYNRAFRKDLKYNITKSFLTDFTKAIDECKFNVHLLSLIVHQTEQTASLNSQLNCSPRALDMHSMSCINQVVTTDEPYPFESRNYESGIIHVNDLRTNGIILLA